MAQTLWQPVVYAKGIMKSRSTYNLKIDTISTYDIPLDRSFLKLWNGHAIYWQKARIKRKDIDGSERLTGVCVCQWVKYSKGGKKKYNLTVDSTAMYVPSETAQKNLYSH